MQQNTLASAAGIAPASLHRIENSDGNLQLSTLYRIAKALSVDPVFLITQDRSLANAFALLGAITPKRRQLIVDLLEEFVEVGKTEDMLRDAFAALYKDDIDKYKAEMREQEAQALAEDEFEREQREIEEEERMQALLDEENEEEK